MNDYTDRILELLKGHSQFKPLRGDDLVAELRHLDPDTLNDMIDDLQGRGAINRAEITKDGKTYTALWPTGLVPRNLSWKQERDNGKGMFGAQLAHNVQQAAEASRAEIKPETKPAPTKDTTMTRIARPAQSVEEHDQTHDRYAKNVGKVQTSILAVIKPGDVLDVDTIFSRLTIETTLGSVGKTLEVLEKRGLIEMALRFHNKRWRRFFSLPGTDVEAAQHAPVCAEPLCAELPGNLRTLRKIAADDTPAPHVGGPACGPIDLINPPLTAEKEPAQTWADAVCGHIPTPKRSDEAAAPIASQADAPTNPENDGGTHFALFDSGTLLITSGDEFIALTAADATRLASYLSNVHDAMAWG